jgi:RalA-binding protein 1
LLLFFLTFSVGIVFAPTLNIPAWLISLLINDYDAVFGEVIDEEKSPIKEISYNTQPNDSIRSPRHQLYTDLPTPSYNQPSFTGVSGFAPLSVQGRAHRTTYTPPVQSQQPNPYTNGFQEQNPQGQYRNFYNAPPNKPENFGSLNMLSAPSQSDTRRNRRESAMMGMDIGIVGQRQPMHGLQE